MFLTLTLCSFIYSFFTLYSYVFISSYFYLEVCFGAIWVVTIISFCVFHTYALRRTCRLCLFALTEGRQTCEDKWQQCFMSYRDVLWRIVSWCFVSYRVVSYHIVSYHHIIRCPPAEVWIFVVLRMKRPSFSWQLIHSGWGHTCHFSLSVSLNGCMWAWRDPRPPGWTWPLAPFQLHSLLLLQISTSSFWSLTLEFSIFSSSPFDDDGSFR